jgi:MFS family permease
VLSSVAIVRRELWLMCVGNGILGSYSACSQYYRFAAADSVEPSYRSRAISLVLAGGIAGGVLGPESTKRTRELLSTPFLGSYLSLVVFAALVLVLVRGLEIPAPGPEESRGGRPLFAIVRQPTFFIAVLGATVGYAVMNFLMTATPLAMEMCRLPYDDTALVIEWHVIGMFAPSFVTGSLVKRFGVILVMLTGALLMFACVALALSGVDLLHFWLALVLLGVGWNFLYVGGTTLLTEAYEPAEKAKAQGANDFCIFATVALTSLASGYLVNRNGWATLNVLSLPLLGTAALGLGFLAFSRRRLPRTA